MRTTTTPFNSTRRRHHQHHLTSTEPQRSPTRLNYLMSWELQQPHWTPPAGATTSTTSPALSPSALQHAWITWWAENYNNPIQLHPQAPPPAPPHQHWAPALSNTPKLPDELRTTTTPLNSTRRRHHQHHLTSTEPQRSPTRLNYLMSWELQQPHWTPPAGATTSTTSPALSPSALQHAWITWWAENYNNPIQLHPHHLTSTEPQRSPTRLNYLMSWELQQPHWTPPAGATTSTTSPALSPSALQHAWITWWAENYNNPIELHPQAPPPAPPHQHWAPALSNTPELPDELRTTTTPLNSTRRRHHQHHLTSTEPQRSPTRLNYLMSWELQQPHWTPPAGATTSTTSPALSPSALQHAWITWWAENYNNPIELHPQAPPPAPPHQHWAPALSNTPELPDELRTTTTPLNSTRRRHHQHHLTSTEPQRSPTCLNYLMSWELQQPHWTPPAGATTSTTSPALSPSALQHAWITWWAENYNNPIQLHPQAPPPAPPHQHWAPALSNTPELPDELRTTTTPFNSTRRRRHQHHLTSTEPQRSPTHLNYLMSPQSSKHYLHPEEEQQHVWIVRHVC